MNKRFGYWAVSNAAFAACLYFGFVEGVEGMRTLAHLYAWFGFVISLCAMSDKVQAMLREKGPPTPPWMDGLFDVGVILTFAWFGSPVTALAYAVHTILLHGVYSQPRALAGDGNG